MSLDRVLRCLGQAVCHNHPAHPVHENALSCTVYQDVLLHGLGPKVDWWIPKGTIEPYGLERITWRK